MTKLSTTTKQSISAKSSLANEVFIGIGANMNDPVKQVKQAINRLSALPLTQMICSSSLYQTKPMGPQYQNDYINAVSQVKTQLDPFGLLHELQTIENEQGRQRNGTRWGPRTLDLDLLLFNNQTIEHANLTVPHYGIKERGFVLVPLFEIAPKLHLPDGSSIERLVNRINLTEIRPV